MDLFISSFLFFLVILDPMGLLPLFKALVHGKTVKEMRHLAGMACLSAAGLGISVALVGPHLLQSLGVSMAALNVAGGLLLFRLAIELVEQGEEGMSPEKGITGFIYPLTIPLIIGPGIISALILAASKHAAIGLGIVLAAYCSAIFVTYTVLFFAGPVMKKLPKPVLQIIVRIFGLLLGAMAIDMVVKGIKGFI